MVVLRSRFWSGLIVLAFLAPQAMAQTKIEPEKAVQVLQALENRIRTVRWTARSTQGKVSDPSNVNTFVPRDHSWGERTVQIDLARGRYRIDGTAVTDWADGAAPKSARRWMVSYDGKVLRDYLLSRAGTEVPTPGPTNPGSGSISEGTGAEEWEKNFLVRSGAWKFPPHLPHLKGTKVSAWIANKAAANAKLSILEVKPGIWQATCLDGPKVVETTMSVKIDVNRGGIVTDISWNSPKGKFVQYTYVKAPSGFWYPTRVDIVNVADKTLDRTEYKNVSFNEPIPDSAYPFTFPVGTIVRNHVSN